MITIIAIIAILVKPPGRCSAVARQGRRDPTPAIISNIDMCVSPRDGQILSPHSFACCQEGVRNRTEPAEPNRVTEPFDFGTARNRTRNRTEPNRTDEFSKSPEPKRVEPNWFLIGAPRSYGHLTIGSIHYDFKIVVQQFEIMVEWPYERTCEDGVVLDTLRA